MRGFKRVLQAVTLGALCSGAFAQVCEYGPPPPYEYRASSYSVLGWFPTKEALCTALMAHMSNANFSYTGFTPNNSNPAQGGACVGTQTYIPNGATANVQIIMQVRTGQTCPPPPPPPPDEPECEADIGDGFWTTSNSPISGSRWCNGLCEMTAQPSTCSGPPELQTCMSWTSVTALSCSGSADGDGDGQGDDGGPADDPPDGSTPGEDGTGQADAPGEAGETCFAVGDGEYCAAPEGDGQCGYFNDTYTCLRDIRPDECKVLADGSRLCGGEAGTTPPVPDNGTPGQLAEPDGQMGQTTGGGVSGGTTTTTYNYYGPTTVVGSSRDPGTTGGVSTGSPHTPTPSDADGDGQQDCAAGGFCGENLPTLEDIGTMDEAFAKFWQELQTVPFIYEASQAAPSFGSGSCPSWSDSFSVFGHTWSVNFSMICTTWDDVSPVISAVCLVFFGFIALRILLSA